MSRFSTGISHLIDSGFRKLVAVTNNFQKLWLTLIPERELPSILLRQTEEVVAV